MHGWSKTIGRQVWVCNATFCHLVFNILFVGVGSLVSFNPDSMNVWFPAARKEKKCVIHIAVLIPLPSQRAVLFCPWLLRRPIYGHYETLLAELNRVDIPAFRNYTSMDSDMSFELVGRLSPRIEKQDTWYWKTLQPGLMVAITLRYLATGDSYHSLIYNFRVAHNTISSIVKDVCQAIIDEYAREVIAAPTTEAKWLQIADLFSSRWNFHNCLGAMDGKPIAIRCPKGVVSLYFNYKKFHFIVLMALVDADYKFIWIDVGANGSASDAQIFNSSELCECIESVTLGYLLMFLYPMMIDPCHSSLLVMMHFLFAHGWWNHSSIEIWRWTNAYLTTSCPVLTEFPRMHLVSWRTVGDVWWNHKSGIQRL